MSSMKMSNFPAVATVIGLSQEVAESGPLLATIAVDQNVVGLQPPPPPSKILEIQTGDPVSQAVVDNIIGKNPTKKEPQKLWCQLCKISVTSQEILNIHYNGQKHARKAKGQELIKEVASSQSNVFSTIQTNSSGNTTDYLCSICNVKVNSYQQMQQHLSGSKHKNKAEMNKLNTTQVSLPANQGWGKGEVKVNIRPNRLYCAACNVHVNSDLQLHQHITSQKHSNKINGRTVSNNSSRGLPYKRPNTRNLAETTQQPSQTDWRRNLAAETNVPLSRPNNTGGLNHPAHRIAPVSNNFVSRGFFHGSNNADSV